MSPIHERPPDLAHVAEAGDTLGQLWRANHELELLSKRMIKTLGVTGPQRMVLRIIARRPGISASGICEAARIHASTLTGILERLVHGGFIERTRDSDDGRRARFDLTPAGARIAEARRGTVESAVITSLSSLTPEERVVVRRWLSAFGDALARERAELGEKEAKGS